VRLAYGKIEVKHCYLALASTGLDKLADVTGSPVSELTAMITGACVDDPNTGDVSTANAGVAAPIRVRKSERCLNIENSPDILII
jgi:hypothetical protein